MNWAEIFIPSVHLGEMIVRGTIMYLILFFALRFFMKRNTGQVGIADILVIVLISEVSQNALVGEAKSVVEAVTLVATILFWSFALNWVSYHVPALQHLTGGAPLPLIKDGRLIRPNLRREMITEEELRSHLRQQGIDDLALVKTACLEGDGNFSVVRHSESGDEGPHNQKKTKVA